MTDNSAIRDLLAQARRLSQSGKPEDSEKIYQRIIALEPENPIPHFELGMLAFQQGSYQPAITHLQNAVELKPGQVNLHNALGIMQSAAGNLSTGEACFKRALELDPGNPVTCSNLGNNFQNQGRLAEAASCYRKVIAAHPSDIKARINLGDTLRKQGELAAAIDIYRTALATDTEKPDIRFKLAVALFQMGETEETVSLLEAVASSHPRYPGVYNNLGLALARLSQFGEAASSYRKAIENEPDSAAPYNNLGNMLKEQNDLTGAINCYRKALAIQPDHFKAHSSLLLTMNYQSLTSQQDLYETALQFGKQQVKGIPKDRFSFSNTRNENRRLRIGYVSPDFRAHSVAHFTRKLIGAHDRDRVEVFCYANVMKQDQITADFRAQADYWVSIVGMDDRKVSDRIMADHIDILVDLAGHTAENRLLVFAHRAAPVQVNWLGYPNTTGLTSMDYRLTDAIADPPGDADRWYSEKLIRLPHGFLCYQSDESRPAVAPCPFLENQFITFGSFNTLAKTTPDVIRIWSEILLATTDARLVLKSKAFSHDQTRERHLREFSRHGIDPERLDLIDLLPNREKHLAAYSGIDIGLDPFPYNGTTTTCEALWMGVPVICLRGDRHSGRVGASILQHAGLAELVAENENDYVIRACSLAADREQLVRLREHLRRKMSSSPVMDLDHFTRSLESAFREMWRNWCRRDR